MTPIAVCLLSYYFSVPYFRVAFLPPANDNGALNNNGALRRIFCSEEREGRVESGQGLLRRGGQKKSLQKQTFEQLSENKALEQGEGEKTWNNLHRTLVKALFQQRNSIA